jgi:hypothetical protein
MSKKTVTVINNFTRIQTFPVGGKLGTRLIPGENKIPESVWAAIVAWVKDHPDKEEADVLTKNKIVGPELTPEVEAAPTTADMLAKDEADKAKNADEAMKVVRESSRTATKKKTSSVAEADANAIKIG